jgi:hypothetical protein
LYSVPKFDERHVKFETAIIHLQENLKEILNYFHIQQDKFIEKEIIMGNNQNNGNNIMNSVLSENNLFSDFVKFNKFLANIIAKNKFIDESYQGIGLEN